MSSAATSSPGASAGRRTPTIPEFFEGRSVLVTGGTGFIGKTVIEKILYSCPGVEKIYLLVRPKKGLSPQERLERLVQQSVFGRLRAEGQTGWQEKLVVVPGDMGAGDCLGLSEEDRRLLVQRVSVFFHCAATVRFDDTLSTAFKLNVGGTLSALRLAQEMKGIKVFTHVSTTYCHTERKEMDEAVYPPPAEWRDVMWAIENLPPFDLSAITHKLLGRLPNTYGFSKALGEQVVYEHRHKLPLLIFRPSIVTSAIQEPLTGWLDNFNGPTGLLVASGKGIVRTLLGEENLISDFCPVDVCVKGIMAASWLRATTYGDRPHLPSAASHKDPLPEVIPEEGIKDPLLPVYNCSTSGVKPVTLGEIQAMGRTLSAETPFNTILWYPGGIMTSSEFLYHILLIFFHLIPAIIVDTGLWMRGQKTRLWRLHRRIYVANKAMKYYLTHQWKFYSHAFSEISSKHIVEEDRPSFALDISAVDEVEYFRSAILGGRRYLLNEPDSTLAAAKTNLRRMYLLDRAGRVFLGLALLLLLWPLARAALTSLWAGPESPHSA